MWVSSLKLHVFISKDSLEQQNNRICVCVCLSVYLEMEPQRLRGDCILPFYISNLSIWRNWYLWNSRANFPWIPRDAWGRDRKTIIFIFRSSYSCCINWYNLVNWGLINLRFLRLANRMETCGCMDRWLLVIPI